MLLMGHFVSCQLLQWLQQLQLLGRQMCDNLMLLDVKCWLVPIAESNGRTADVMNNLQNSLGCFLLPNLY